LRVQLRKRRNYNGLPSKAVSAPAAWQSYSLRFVVIMGGGAAQRTHVSALPQ
jgi:hypothetical protein